MCELKFKFIKSECIESEDHAYDVYHGDKQLPFTIQVACDGYYAYETSPVDAPDDEFWMTDLFNSKNLNSVKTVVTSRYKELIIDNN